MKISTKGRYALRLMLELAINYNKCVSLKSISDKQQISIKYLEQIVNILNHSGLVKSTRGPLGGYSLCKSPQDYTIGLILRAVEGNLSPVACLEPGSNNCPRIDNCVTIFIWKKIQDAISDIVDNITLKDLVDLYPKLNN